jgi:hypothetical protein
MQRNLGRAASAGKNFLNGYGPERLAALLAVGGLAISILINFHVRAWEGYASDFKTMYGSIWSLLHGRSAYDFANIAAVFDANGVIEPRSWYAHAPVYPPFTLALMAPLAALPMVPAIYVWFGICAAAFAGALASLARAAGEEFKLSRGWRLALIGAAPAWPLCSFGLKMENVSIAVCSLCILAVTAQSGDRRWFRAAGLAIALLLKPHIALWVLIGLLLIPDARGRWMAVRGAGMAAAAALVLCLPMALHGDLGMQVSGYRDMLHSELTSGSMSASNHELMDVGAQILSLNSLVSFFPETEGAAGTAVVTIVLLAAASMLVWVSLRRYGSRQERYPLLAAWCGLGLLATYHRAHDGLVLLLLLPWLANRLRASWRDAVAWVSLVMLAAMGVAPRWETWQALATHRGFYTFSEFLLYRQAPAAVLLLFLVVGGTIWHARMQAAAVSSPAFNTSSLRGRLAR